MFDNLKKAYETVYNFILVVMLLGFLYLPIVLMVIGAVASIVSITLICTGAISFCWSIIPVGLVIIGFVMHKSCWGFKNECSIKDCCKKELNK